MSLRPRQRRRPEHRLVSLTGAEFDVDNTPPRLLDRWRSAQIDTPS